MCCSVGMQRGTAEDNLDMVSASVHVLALLGGGVCPVAGRHSFLYEGHIPLLGTVAYASRPRVQIYPFAYTSRSIHHSHYSYFSYYLVLTPVICLLTKPTPQGSYWLVYCSFVPQHVFLSFLAPRSSFS